MSETPCSDAGTLVRDLWHAREEQGSFSAQTKSGRPGSNPEDERDRILEGFRTAPRA